MKIRILFVCLGNICRSPAAEGILKAMVENQGFLDDFYIDSAGIGSWHVGDLPDRRMRHHGMLRGYDFNSRARQVTTSDFQKFDLIIVMDDENYYDIKRFCTMPNDMVKVHRINEYFVRYQGRPDVPDPYYGGDSDFKLALDLLEDACQGIINKVMTK
ncbi:MAG: low molecular weight phosphotyrosine protein phosphatase [Bacteroidaceae bacterium]|nr:low molecular weight phosphotyrosine protein phosphatase [Bacteroidaceae bacterium]